MRSLPNYLNRIGLKHAPLKADLSTLALVMAAHSRAIAFENIDVVRGKTISMARGDVEKKLVDDLRGGYCWEQNTLLSMALEEIGFGNKAKGVGGDRAADASMVMTSYSGGWKMKMQLGAALLVEADLLMLDEPTGHLDVRSAAGFDFATSLSEVC